MKRIILLFLLFFFFFPQFVFADSSYVLPYPSAMPGGISYKIHLVLEEFMKYWYFGDFGQFDYNLKESDKYLVEAKTLFEYNQYLLGYNALQKSDDFFKKALPNLDQAKKDGKNTNDKRELLKEAGLKHEEILKEMETETPVSFNWSPEKSPSSELSIHILLERSIKLTKQYE